jgi:hypothetical protein
VKKAAVAEVVAAVPVAGVMAAVAAVAAVTAAVVVVAAVAAVEIVVAVEIAAAAVAAETIPAGKISISSKTKRVKQNCTKRILQFCFTLLVLLFYFYPNSRSR